MGWAKYTEDNFEIYLERMEAIRYNPVRQQATERKQKIYETQNSKSNSFSQRLPEKLLLFNLKTKGLKK